MEEKNKNLISEFIKNNPERQSGCKCEIVEEYKGQAIELQKELSEMHRADIEELRRNAHLSAMFGTPKVNQTQRRFFNKEAGFLSR